ncbi:MAG TPA: sensor domain-containing diguanylate cyclase [Bryobacteraceae bacterium]|nr:sensor domain-containing diguanylate cyclase [Bryobacteraceae bacterium]
MATETFLSPALGRLPFLAAFLLHALLSAVLAGPLLYRFVIRPFRSAIAREANKASAILDGAPEAIFEVGPGGRIQTLNEEAVNLFAYTREELIGQQIEILIPSRFRGSHVTNRERYSAHPRKRPMGGGLELAGLKKNGEEFPIEISLNEVNDQEVPAVICVVRDISLQKAAAREILQANERLAESLTAHKALSEALSQLRDFSELLESCTARSEAYPIVAKMFDRLFPGQSGSVLLATASKTALERITSWGELSTPKPVLPIHECWALRRGKIYTGELTPCSGCTAAANRPQNVRTMCVPMIAQGDMIGVLHLSTKPSGTDLPAITPAPLSPENMILAATVERTSVALANLRLREELRDQAVRDTLTGLFNRRFLEEYLELELFRALRNGLPLTVMMLDADHFKRFNDTFGHKAGDLVLRELAGVIRSLTRNSDMACRFGGEELVVVYPETSLAQGTQRAEQIRQAIENLTVVDAGQRLGKVSVSIGVASAPEHGYGIVGLLQAADEALYAAKKAGRNRVMQATVQDVVPASNAEQAARQDITAESDAVKISSELGANTPTLSTP